MCGGGRSVGIKTWGKLITVAVQIEEKREGMTQDLASDRFPVFVGRFDRCM